MSEALYREFAGMIDHALLVPTMTRAELRAGCALAAAYGCASACVMPYFVGEAATLLGDTDTVACCVIGFPHGNHLTAAKVAEAEAATRAGAAELDMVCNISLVKSGAWDAVADDLRAVIDAGHAGSAKVKVIFETCYLTDDEIRRLCTICGDLRADWIKTSTGFGNPPTGTPAGATDAHLTLMRSAAPPHVQVKASGGVRDFARLQRIRDLGCTRAGASATQPILDEARTTLNLPKIKAPSQHIETSY
ncbi:MAG: deoxyribose-phosphate aldolase [Planctomycetota bacterium]